MSELTKLYEEIRRTQELWREKKLSDDDAATELRFFKRREQVIKQVVAIKMHSYPEGGNKFQNSLASAQIDNATSAIRLLPLQAEHETVLCPLLNKEMTRGECLEYSGEQTHYEDCKGCEVGLETKRLLAPPVQESIK